ncbi:MAG: hypothetical protein M3N08_09965 [Pseudomonadota bacterium]|nr:hypothetical protein [Pseudomonadota bacterium]
MSYTVKFDIDPTSPVQPLFVAAAKRLVTPAATPLSFLGSFLAKGSVQEVRAAEAGAKSYELVISPSTQKTGAYVSGSDIAALAEETDTRGGRPTVNAITVTSSESAERYELTRGEIKGPPLAKYVGNMVRVIGL